MRKLMCSLTLMAATSIFVISTRAASLPNPIVNGNEWYQPIDLIDYSWDDISAVCNSNTGRCNGSLAGGQNLTGWTWASVDDVNALFNAYIGSVQLGPGPDLYLESESAWAPEFFTDFDEIDDPIFTGTTVNGLTRTIISTDPMAAAGATLGDQIIGTPGGDGPDSATTTGILPLDYSSEYIGVWAYRPSEVPIPAAAWLFGSALVGLGLAKRKKA